MSIHSWRAFAPVFCLAALGCSREESPSAPVTLSFDGRTWELVGPCDAGRIARSGMVAKEYKTAEPNVRLVELTLDERSAQAERLNVRIRRVQVNRGGRWIDDGLKVCNYHDGSRMETRMTLGVFGEQKEWDERGNRVIFRGCADDLGTVDGNSFDDEVVDP